MKVKSAEGEVEEYETEDAIFSKVSTHLADRFRLAFTAPSDSGQLFDDIGFVGDMEAARAILEGTYEYPSDIDPATKLLLGEAAITYLRQDACRRNCNVCYSRGLSILLATGK